LERKQNCKLWRNWTEVLIKEVMERWLRDFLLRYRWEMENWERTYIIRYLFRCEVEKGDCGQEPALSFAGESRNSQHPTVSSLANQSALPKSIRLWGCSGQHIPRREVRSLLSRMWGFPLEACGPLNLCIVWVSEEWWAVNMPCIKAKHLKDLHSPR